MSLNKIKTAVAAMTFTVIASLTACQPSTDDPGDFVTFGDSGWAYRQPQVFHCTETPDTVDRVKVTIRHTNAYEWANVWLEITYQAADTTRCDTIDFTLADDMGRWLGHGTGTSYQRADTITLRRPAVPKSDIIVRQIMRVDTLREVEQLGLTRLPR